MKPSGLAIVRRGSGSESEEEVRRSFGVGWSWSSPSRGKRKETSYVLFCVTSPHI